jgi:BCD family chlorophyll transporter-like MFS transporter
MSAASRTASPLGWLGIVRLGLVQAALGAIVVLATSTDNRVMVVELGLPAMLPGALVALHYGIQILRPRLGYGSDLGQRRTPWIIGGMAVLALGGLLAAVATAAMAAHPALGIATAVAAFIMVGVGVGACGTSLLTLLAKRVAPARRGAAATLVWVMMIAGIAITATAAGRALDPFSPARLVTVTAVVVGVAWLLTVLAVWGVEGAAIAEPATALAPAAQTPFLQALQEIWAEAQARRFAIFVFVSMFAYSAQELILEPFVGAVFHLTPGASTGLTGLQHGGVLCGMVLVAVATGVFGGKAGALRSWTIGGCLGSALAILAVAATAHAHLTDLVRPAVFALGAANGAFTVSAIGAMMGLAHSGRGQREGTRMGLWGAAQAIAFGLGGLVGSSASDLARLLLGSPAAAYTAVFIAEALLFLLAAHQARHVFATSVMTPSQPPGDSASAVSWRPEEPSYAAYRNV